MGFNPVVQNKNMAAHRPHKVQLKDDEKEFVHLVLMAVPWQKAAEMASKGMTTSKSYLNRQHIVAALLQNFQRLAVKWSDLLYSSKRELLLVLDDAEASAKDKINAAKCVLESLIKSKSMPLADMAMTADGDPVDRILGLPAHDGKPPINVESEEVN